MTPMNDPWWLVLIKVVAVVVVLLVWTIFNVWYERRLVGKMQHRKGPIMNGPLGLGQALADGVKLLFKEDFMPAMVDKALFILAPVITGTAAFTAWAMIPFGGEVEVFGVTTRLQVTDLPVGVLMILAVTSVGIYGFVLAGWSSNSPYSLLGALRSSAQMVSYEVSMGLCFAAVFLWAGSMSTSEIVLEQAQPLKPFGLDFGMGNWYWLPLLPSFVIYVISMVGETNRAPFDLVEAESELVSGYLTEYSGFRYAIYFLAEYINMATVSAIATTLFAGGYLCPWPFSLVPGLDWVWLGPVWFVVKVQLFISLFVWLRGTLPRFRYDQFMSLGWKRLIPIAAVWLVFIACLRWMMNSGALREWMGWILIGAVVLIVVMLALSYLWPAPQPPPVDEPEEFDAFAGGFPVAPLPGRQAPTTVPGLAAEPLVENVQEG